MRQIFNVALHDLTSTAAILIETKLLVAGRMTIVGSINGVTPANRLTDWHQEHLVIIFLGRELLVFGQVMVLLVNVAIWGGSFFPA